MIKVSIIVPVYNVEKYIERCLNSLIRQTLDEIEIVVVNDGSTDNSQVIIDKFVKKYPEKVISLKKKNGGLSDARNFGISYCSGEYIGFVDSDDYVEPDMYKEMYHSATINKSDIVMCNYIMEFSTKRKLISIENIYEPKDIFFNMRAVAWNKIYRCNLLKESNVLFPVGLIYEDTAFFSELLLHIKKVSYVNKAFVHYVQRNGSISNTQDSKTAQIFDIFDKIIDYYKKSGYYDEYKTRIEYLCVRILLGSSLERISGIDSKQLRKKFAIDTIMYLDNKFPNWRKNIQIRRISKRNVFIGICNKKTIKYIVSIMHFFYIRKRR